MAAILRSAAANVANRGQPSTFYSKDKNNPVFQSLDQEIKKFMGYMRKRNAPGYKKPDEEPSSRPSDTLFELWNKYEPKLSKEYYQSKLLEVGDFLVLVKEYSTALWQCYDRYLMHFGNLNVEEITDVDAFKKMFFPGGFDSDNAGLTFRALMGKSISMYQMVKARDPKLQNKQSVERCVLILNFLRLVMQVVLPKETLCWLVYNGTVHIYSMSRHLMSLGHSSRALEYLLWASMCMETSVPLLAVKYLPWRATLYTAVCQCYFDCKQSQHAEAFARRGLAKINELSNLENLSSSIETPLSEITFRTATVKMAIMVFKRSVYETRRKPKALLRPKTRANLKEASHLTWPRTPSEKLLADMFEGSGSQFLCILESLTDTNRRILLTSPPASDSEVEILDVYAELFMAGQEILAGGGGHRGSSIKPTSNVHLPALAGIIKDSSIMDMASKGEDGCSIEGAIRLVKLAYSFEQWEVFDTLVENVLTYIRILNNSKYNWDEKALELLLAMEKVNPSRRHKRNMASVVDDVEKDGGQTAEPKTTMESQAATSTRSLSLNDDLIQVAEVMMTIVNGPFVPSKIEVDMVVDAALFLWNKTKSVFQKHQSGSADNPKYLQKMENPNKWVYILDVVHKVLCWCGISSVDPALTAEVVLRLALVFESSAHIDDGFFRSKLVTHSSKFSPDEESTLASFRLSSTREGTFALRGSKMSLDEAGQDGSQHHLVSRTSMLSSSMLNINPRQQLLQARDILDLGLKNVSYARQAVALSDGKSIADVSWAKDIQDDVFTPEPASQRDTNRTEGVKSTEEGEGKEDASAPGEGGKGSATAVWNTIKDLHLELILMYHRVCLKLAGMGPDPAENIPKPFKRRDVLKQDDSPDFSPAYIEDYKELLGACRKNYLSKALLFMQKSLLLSTSGITTTEQKSLLQDAVNMIQKSQTDEKRVYTENTNVSEVPDKPRKVPPPPILLCRTDSMMVFKPAPFSPENGQVVAWYRIFARSSSGSNVKVRLNDYNFPGTGDEVPSFRCELRVSGLRPNERYVFAVAAYNADGQLIGGGVGESSKPILASHPLPVLMTWGFLSQIAYQVGCYDIARQACNVLWGHFIAKPPAPQTATFTSKSEGAFNVILMKLNQKVVCVSSPVLLRQFLTSIFISVDMSVKEGELFCDVVCDKGPLLLGQMKRLGECEKMLVALELAGWLNEANLAMQAVVQCYGLLAPLIFYKIPSLAVVQVLQRCHVVLQEVPASLRQKRQQSIADSLHHMTACITYSMAKVLRSWGHKQLANNINEAGRRLLALEGEDPKDKKHKDKEQTDITEKGALSGGETSGDEKTDASDSLPLHALKRKRAKRVGQGTSKEETEGPVNEELKALEAHMLSLSKQAQYEHELSGFEDPSILHAYIAYLPSKLAYREVVKFKRRHRYLEFFVQVAQKALTEGMANQVMDWCDDTATWLSKRNEQIIGMRQYLGKQPGVVTVSGDDPKRFAAAMVEYTKEKEMTTPRVPGSKIAAAKPSTTKPRRRRQYRPVMVNSSMTDSQRQAQEEAELKAIEIFTTYFPDMFRQWHRKRKLRKMTVDEMPWRCQLVLLQGMSHFSAFLQRLETRDKVLGTANMYRTNFLDEEWFGFETAGTLVVGWEGGPTKPVEPQSRRRFEDDEEAELARLHTSHMDALDLAEHESRPRTTATGIEIAAALATGEVPEFPKEPESPALTGSQSQTERIQGTSTESTTNEGTTNEGSAPPPMYFYPPEQEDTPRTYRSDASNVPAIPKHTQKEIDNVIISTKEITESLSKTFSQFKKAIILAHRGQHWTLLQNSCRTMWNCAHTALLRAIGPEDGLLSVDNLRAIVWFPMYTAADCTLDMLVHLQTDLEKHAEKAKSKNRKLGDLFETWTGDITREKGGASLKFESPLDDSSVCDIRFISRFVLRVLEMLYYEQKWEKLVDIAMRFSGLTDDRYAEQVLPILVQAQRQIVSLLSDLRGEMPPQKHYRELLQRLGGVVTSKDYLHTQLTLVIDPDSLPPIPPGAAIDPMGHGIYTIKDGQMSVSVPLDIPLSLHTLREVLDKSQYTCRALHHSRKLLILYLAGQQNTGDGFLSRQISRVEFVPTTAKPQPTMPPDISRDDFHDMNDVLTTCMPRSQLGTVISSYEKAIAMLLAKNQRSQAAQAMHELGNLQYHASNIRAAYKWWAESLDHTLNMTNALHTWRAVLKDSTDISSELLKRCGLWGCLMGGVLASNIAQYILTSDLGLRMECCFLSGYFFKALFRTSLPHPRADRDYALYEVGEGCEVTNLVPGVDMLSEKFRCDGRQLVAGIRWVTEELARGKHNLFVLPLLTLNQYLTTFVCRDLQRSVDGRILKVRVLTDLRLFNEAFITLQRLLHGERLPQIGDSHFRQVESKMSSIKFNTSKPITEAVNLRVLEMVLDKRLSSSLATLYGPHMTCHLSVVQAHLFVSLADTIPVIPKMEDVILTDGQKEMKPFTISTISRGGLGTKGIKLPSSSGTGPRKSTRSSSGTRKDDAGEEEEEEHHSGHVTKRFTQSKKPLTLELIKGTLLTIADQMVTTIAEVILENAEHDKAGLDSLPAAELELVVLCKLQQALISRQKQHAPMAARIILSALKLLKNSQLFKPRKEAPIIKRPSSLKGTGLKKDTHSSVKIVHPENSQFQYQNFQSRSRLDARLWLDCRQALVQCLMMEVRSLGEIKDPETKVLQELADCRQYCIEGLGEAEACGDVEMQAEFFIQGAILNITEGKSLDHTVSLLQDAIKLLQKIPKLSIPGEQLLTRALVLRTDLEAVERDDETVLFTERTLDQYLEAQNLILKQLERLGEAIEHYHPNQMPQFSAPVSPMKNIYLPQLSQLVKVKLRVGHAISRNTAKYIRSGSDKDPVQLWSGALGVLMTARELSQASVTREANLEAEILLNLGKVQRMLVYLGKFPPRKAVETLLEAITTSFNNDHDLGLMRQAYMEIALVYLQSSGLISMKENSTLEVVADTQDPEIASAKTDSSRKTKSWKKSPVSSPDMSKKDRLSSRTKSSKSDEVGDQEKERRAAWLAIRCAAAVAEAQRARMLLIGDVSVTSQKLQEVAQENIPDFVALDLVSAYVLGEKKKVYKNEIEEELAPLIEAQEVKKVETYEEQVNRAKDGAKDLGWIHFLGYQTVLQRLCSTSTISASSIKSDNTLQDDTDPGDLGPEFDLGFISHAQCDTTVNHDVVRSMLFGGIWSRRTAKLHTYLATHLKVYSERCCAVYPPATLSLPTVANVRLDSNVLYKSYTQNLTMPADQEESLQTAGQGDLGKAPPPPGSNSDQYRPPDKAVTTPTDTEVAIQFYQPSLEENDPQRPEAVGPDSRILLLYALSNKKVNQPGLQWVTLSQLNDLHDRLALLAQRGEISLQEKEKKTRDPVTPSPTPTAKSKKTQRIKALSPKVQRDERLEGLLKQCVDDVTTILGALTDQAETASIAGDIPFEVNRQNIRNLEGLFDPGFGFILRGSDMVTWLVKLLLQQ
ncbi:cilia- and flagella-associated protein 54-like isoform X4 [Ostrea edulis]|uniref:cilia- and flagella-associated protein 54-like isoform X4 n=1 Tax=Ostrea edulis TaxID=37623 RepID=UPI0024AFF8A3|nr:cilia- and flagella-associated protein 54-like isoform X4 [Ostrea edulis]